MRTTSWLLCLACATGCRAAREPTETIVTIDAEPAVRAATSRVSVQTETLAGQATRELSSETWPIKLVLAPQHGDASRRFKLQVDVLGAGAQQLVGLNVETGFVADAARYAALLIRDSCAPSANPSCTDESCNTWQLDPAGLGTSAAHPYRKNITCQPGSAQADAGAPLVDAGGSAGGNAGAAAAAGSVANAGRAGGTGQTMSPQQMTPGGTNPGSGPCGPGFMAAGGQCVDIDECTPSNPCGDHGQCQNQPGGYTCQCDPGYQSNQATCVDIDECQTNNGGCQDTCINTPGGSSCACSGDAFLKSDGRGCGHFGAPQRLTISGSAAPCYPQAAFDANGGAVVVWTQSDGMQQSLWTNRDGGSGWVGARQLSALASGSVQTPRLALDGKGQGVLVFVQAGASHNDLWAAKYDAGAFVSPVLIENQDAGDVSSPNLALDGTGNGLVVWTYANGSHTEVWANRFVAARGWGLARHVAGSDTLNALWARVSLDASGRGSLVWTQFEASDASFDMWPFAPYTARFDPTTGLLGLPISLDNAGQAALPDVAFESSGNGIALWQRREGDRMPVYARTFSAMSGWAAPVKVSVADSDLSQQYARVAISATGDAVAIWSELQGAGARVWASRYRAATADWAQAIELSPMDSTTSASSAVALDAAGSGFAAWFDFASDMSRAIHATRIGADGSFGAAQQLDSDQTPSYASPVQIALDAQGNALVVWDKRNGTQYEVWASRLE